MSELKATTVYDAYWKANSVGEGTGVLVYLKSEADKVIAEKDKEIQRLENLCESYTITTDRMRTVGRTLREKMTHQKYKRCLAMARWCELKRIDAADYRIPREKLEFYDKWYKRLLELADKLKEAK